jgi:phosphoribosylformimino-5-aminoimidazole carboxamide ribotide isomerase
VFRRHPGALAMLIPSIDLMDGKIVQLIQGQKKALEFDDFTPWIERFSRFPLVQLIDLDAALGQGNNHDLVKSLCRQLPCQVGGGVRSTEAAANLLAAGARRVIIGSSLFREGTVNQSLVREMARVIGSSQLVFAVDSKNGRVVTQGWKNPSTVTAAEAIPILEPWCHAFLYTHVDSEGLLQGFPLSVALELRQLTTRQLIVAGGVASGAEIEALAKIRVDAVVGMAIYTGKIPCNLINGL